MVDAVLGGQPGPAADVVLANAAAALIAAERANDPKQAVALAAQAISSGGALGVLQALRNLI